LVQFIFGDRSSLAKYLNSCCHRIGGLIVLLLVFLIVIFYAPVDFILLLLLILVDLLVISLLYHFGVELCDFRGVIRLRTLPFWGIIAV
jgi:hypothetical protein